MMAISPAAWAWEHARARPDAPAVDGSGVRLTYGELARAAGALAAELRAAGFGPGRRLVVALPSAPSAVVALLAAQLAGGSAVPLDRGAGGAALRNVLAQTGARHAVGWAPDLPIWTALGAARPERLWTVPSGEAGEAPAAAGEWEARLDLRGAPVRPSSAPAEPWPVAPGDEALVLFTSGSTGEPRGVVQTYGNLLANTRSIVEYLGLRRDDRAMAILPLFYCYGLSVLQTHLYVGGSVFLEPRSMYPRVVLDGIAAEGCTGFAGVPLTFELLRRQCDAAAAPKPRLRYLTQAGGAMAQETIRWARQAFHPALLYVMYGQTEATARLAYLPPERAEEKAGSIGIAIPGVELRVVGPDGGELPAGEVGELVARGDNVTAGYLGAPAETAATFREDGLHTGDLARRDEDGFFFIAGRAKEMLKIGGHRESPARIEQVALQHPDVLEVAVAGVPDALMGEVPAMFVVRRPDRSAGERELRAFCRQHLPAHCVPVAVRFLPSLPRSTSGKLLRQELARLALAMEDA
ncbi:MAG TPA: class I adenylate-forming enzyme family protein [Anaeromyxobacteraceae bacterium]|jgi:acyl-CoA synthetase (AMP-forming)/AMP-acid ligase II|nr:class I adenylate-forming enzyme family protein [Anaeromyxobacteraceae bacterium]